MMVIVQNHQVVCRLKTKKIEKNRNQNCKYESHQILKRHRLTSPSRLEENYASHQATPSNNVTDIVTPNIISIDYAKVIITLLQGLKQTQDQNTLKIDNLHKLMNANHNATNLMAPNPLPPMPLQNTQNFLNMESYLENPENYTYFINRLSVIGGTDVRNSTMNILKFILTDNLASCYNWAGRKSTCVTTAEPKLSFKTTLIMRAISDSIKIAYSKLLPSDLNDQHIEKAVKDWLKLAPQRFCNKSNKKHVNFYSPWPSN